MKKYFSKTISIISALILTDQFIKLVIWVFFFNVRFSIIPGVISFYPVINTFLSWFAFYLPFTVNPFFLYLSNIATFIFILYLYNRHKQQTTEVKTCVKIVYMLAVAGCICSFVDKIFYGGSIDYIYLESFFVLDLKDLYIIIAEIGVLLALVFPSILNGRNIQEDAEEVAMPKTVEKSGANIHATAIQQVELPESRSFDTALAATPADALQGDTQETPYPEKKKRGRPRKVRVDNEVTANAVQSKASQNTGAENAPSTSPAEAGESNTPKPHFPKKRKKSRPRKIATTQEQPSEADAPTEGKEG